MRPGEKLYEELNMDDEPTVPTANGAITVIKGVRPEVADVRVRLDELGAALPLERDENKACAPKKRYPLTRPNELFNSTGVALWLAK